MHDENPYASFDEEPENAKSVSKDGVLPRGAIIDSIMIAMPAVLLGSLYFHRHRDIDYWQALSLMYAIGLFSILSAINLVAAARIRRRSLRP